MTIGKCKWSVCQPNTPAAFTPQEMFLVLISVKGWVGPRAIVRPERLRQVKILRAPSAIEPQWSKYSVPICDSNLLHITAKIWMSMPIHTHCTITKKAAPLSFYRQSVVKKNGNRKKCSSQTNPGNIHIFTTWKRSSYKLSRNMHAECTKCPVTAIPA